MISVNNVTLRYGKRRKANRIEESFPRFPQSDVLHWHEENNRHRKQGDLEIQPLFPQ
jgi:hypothetical protein